MALPRLLGCLLAVLSFASRAQVPSVLSLDLQAVQAPKAGAPAVPVASVEAGSVFLLNLNYTVIAGDDGVETAHIEIDLPDGLGVTGQPSYGALAGWTGACVQNGAWYGTNPARQSYWKWRCQFANPLLARRGEIISGQVQIPMKVRRWVPTGRDGAQVAFSASFAGAGSAAVEGTGAVGVTAKQAIATGLGYTSVANWEINPVTGESGASFIFNAYATNDGTANLEGGSIDRVRFPRSVWVKTVAQAYWIHDAASVTTSLGPLSPTNWSVTNWTQGDDGGTDRSIFISTSKTFAHFNTETGDAVWTDYDVYSHAAAQVTFWIPCSALPDFQATVAGRTFAMTVEGVEAKADGTLVPVLVKSTTSPDVRAGILSQRCGGGPGDFSKTVGGARWWEGGYGAWTVSLGSPLPPVQQVDDVVISDYVRQDGQRFSYMGPAESSRGLLSTNSNFLVSAGGSFEVYYCNFPGVAGHLAGQRFLDQLAAQGSGRSPVVPVGPDDTACSTEIRDFDPTLFTRRPATSVNPQDHVSHVVLYAAHWGRNAVPGGDPGRLPEPVKFQLGTSLPLPFACDPATDQGLAHDEIWVETPADPLYATPKAVAATTNVACGAFITPSSRVAFPADTAVENTVPVGNTFQKGQAFWYDVTLRPTTAVPAYNPQFTATLAPGLAYVPGSTHFDLNTTKGAEALTGQGFTAAGQHAEPVVTTLNGSQVLTWTPETQSGALLNDSFVYWQVKPDPIPDPLTGKTTWWWAYPNTAGYWLRFQVQSDPAYPFLDGAKVSTCLTATESNATHAAMLGKQTSCADAYVLAPAEMKASVVPLAECAQPGGGPGRFLVTARNTGGTVLTNFRVTAPLPAGTRLAVCDLEASAGAAVTYLTATGYGACPADLSTVTGVRVTIASLPPNTAPLTFKLPVAVSGWEPVTEHVTLECATLAPITSGEADQPLVPGANCCTPDCSGRQCGPDGCGGTCGAWGGTCAGAAAPGACQVAAACSAEGQCVHASQPQGVSCDDGRACTSGDACDGDGACRGADDLVLSCVPAVVDAPDSCAAEVTPLALLTNACTSAPAGTVACATAAVDAQAPAATAACLGGTPQQACLASVALRDVTPPRFSSCPAADTVVEVLADAACAGEARARDVVEVFENCSPGQVSMQCGSAVLGPAELSPVAFTLTCSAPTDAAGNTDASASCPVRFAFRDATPPQLTCPAPLTLELGSACTQTTAVAARASDNCDASVEVACEQVTLAAGQSGTVVCRATDAAGNEASCEVAVAAVGGAAPALALGILEGASAAGGTCNDSPVALPFSWSGVCSGAPLPRFAAQLQLADGSVRALQVKLDPAGADGVVRGRALLDPAGLVGTFRVSLTATDAAGAVTLQAATVAFTTCFCTFTQGGWGTTCKGGNPGCIRDAGFAAAFPSGLQLGNASTHLRFSTSGAVDAFLPAGGTAGALQPGKSLLNPKSSSAGVLAGQLAAANLSLRYDSAGLLKGKAEKAVPLGSLVVAAGKFAGTSVAALVELGNAAIAGDPTALATRGATLVDLNAALTAVNEGFDNCSRSTGFLVRPGPR